MVGRWRPGSGAQWDKREEFGRLIALGVSNAEACRIVGVNRKTGHWWRHGRTITGTDGRTIEYPPVATAQKRDISSRFLSAEERVVIADLRRAGHGEPGAAAEPGRGQWAVPAVCGATPRG